MDQSDIITHIHARRAGFDLAAIQYDRRTHYAKPDSAGRNTGVWRVPIWAGGLEI